MTRRETHRDRCDGHPRPAHHPSVRGAASGPPSGAFFVPVADRNRVFFKYTARESSNAVLEMFHGFSGYMQADAKSVYYTRACLEPGIYGGDPVFERNDSAPSLNWSLGHVGTVHQ